MAHPSRTTPGMPLSRNPFNPVHRVLMITELLMFVFSFLTQAELAVLARVCKEWSDIALDMLWRCVDDLPRLLRLLAPFQEQVDGMHFIRPLEQGDWMTFMNYSPRIRTLTLDPDGDASLPGLFLFGDLFGTNAPGTLFPSLSSLTWLTQTSERMYFSCMLMHKILKEFTVQLHLSRDYPIDTFFRSIKSNSPELNHLDLRFSFPVRKIEDHLCSLLEALPKLRKLSIPPFCLTTKIMETLSRLPLLRVVGHESSQESSDSSSIMNFNPILKEGAFPELEALFIDAPILDIQQFIASPFFPSTLRVLETSFLDVSVPTVLHNLLSAIAQACPLLLELHLASPSPIPYKSSPSEHTIVSWKSLRPVLRCSRLNTFVFRWDTPLEITQNDIEEIAKGWPHLEVLMLNNDSPLINRPMTLTLESLLPLAQHCPELCEIGLCLDATTLTTALFSKAATMPSFRKLYWLSFGLSKIEDPGRVALFLSYLCPPQCEISGGSEYAITAVPAEELGAYTRLMGDTTAWKQRWAAVHRDLPLVMQARAEERKRMKELQREVEALRTMHRELEKKLDMWAGELMVKCCVIM